MRQTHRGVCRNGPFCSYNFADPRRRDSKIFNSRHWLSPSGFIKSLECTGLSSLNFIPFEVDATKVASVFYGDIIKSRGLDSEIHYCISTEVSPDVTLRGQAAFFDFGHLLATLRGQAAFFDFGHLLAREALWQSRADCQTVHGTWRDRMPFCPTGGLPKAWPKGNPSPAPRRSSVGIGGNKIFTWSVASGPDLPFGGGPDPSS